MNTKDQLIELLIGKPKLSFWDRVLPWRRRSREEAAFRAYLNERLSNQEFIDSVALRAVAIANEKARREGILKVHYNSGIRKNEQ